MGSVDSFFMGGGEICDINVRSAMRISSLLYE